MSPDNIEDLIQQYRIGRSGIARTNIVQNSFLVKEYSHSSNSTKESESTSPIKGSIIKCKNHELIDVDKIISN